MFSGLVETTSTTLSAIEFSGIIRLSIARPSMFNDVTIGDSICCNGVCLTVVEICKNEIQFDIGLETQKITGWSQTNLLGKVFNLERSLKLGDRLHGHIVLGHVDAMGAILDIIQSGKNKIFWISFPDELKDFFWEKGSLCVDGVSLTINSLSRLENKLSVCLIPETQKVTNLGNAKKSQKICLEADNLVKGLVHNLNNLKLNGFFEKV